MPITTEYKCDSCGHAQDTPQNTGADGSRYMFTVAILFQDVAAGYGRHQFVNPSKHDEKVWCVDCLEKNGLRRPLLKADDQPPAYPTFEELVRQIVRSEMEG